MDMIVKLPESNGKDSILVVVDQGLSKGVKFIPCNETIDAQGIAELLIDNVYSLYGLPEYIISD
jgi:peroxiredoxin family protein